VALVPLLNKVQEEFLVMSILNSQVEEEGFLEMHLYNQLILNKTQQ